MPLRAASSLRGEMSDASQSGTGAAFMVILDAIVLMLALAFAASIVLASLVEIIRSDQPELLRVSVRVPVQRRGRPT